MLLSQYAAIRVGIGAGRIIPPVSTRGTMGIRKRNPLAAALLQDIGRGGGAVVVLVRLWHAVVVVYIDVDVVQLAVIDLCRDGRCGLGGLARIKLAERAVGYLASHSVMPRVDDFDQTAASALCADIFDANANRVGLVAGGGVRIDDGVRHRRPG